MEINFPFVYSGKKYSSDEFLSSFVCAECKGSLVITGTGTSAWCSKDEGHTGFKLFKEGGKMATAATKPFEIKDVTTLTGIPIMEALTMLNAQLESTAYKAMKLSGMVLTDINPGYLVEEMNRIFGPHGWGWRCDFSKDDIVVDTGQFKSGAGFFNVSLIGLKMYYTILVNGVEREIGPIISTGGATNSKIEFALKGAVTNAIGGAAHRLGWQVDVYKGLRSHDQATTPINYDEDSVSSGPSISFVDAASMHYKLDTEKAIAASGADYAPAIQYNLVRSLDENTPASKLAEMIGEEAAKATKHTLAELMGLAKCEWAITTELFGKPAKDITLGEFCSMWTAFVRIINGEKKETVVKQYQDMTGKK